MATLNIVNTLSEHHRSISLLAGIFLSLLAFFYVNSYSSLGFQAAVVAGVAALCATWWIFVPIPIPATSLIPIAVLPLMSVLSAQQVAQAYGNKIILLLMGGCVLSKAMEHTNTHRKVAVVMLGLIGAGSARRVVWAFMIVTAALSMWISNTATSLMMLPIALAILQASKQDSLTIPLLLGIAYAASIGGIGTPIGTPPNLIMLQIYEQYSGETISFSRWMLWCLPVVAILLIVTAFWLVRNLKDQTQFDLPEEPNWTAAQKRVLLIFLITAIAWMTRTEPFGGWSAWFGLPNANDASVVLVSVILMFLIPNGEGKGESLLNWEKANEIPWGMLILFSGGIALASGFQASGLSAFIGESFKGFSAVSAYIVIVVVCLSVTFLTEVTSNTASASLLMPILAATALAMNVDAMWLMFPAALSASCAFMLPVATAPNAVVYGSGKIDVPTMARNGLILNLIGTIVIAGFVSLWMTLSRS
jgi:sodium-dependent dicarboxylate transporter 2/3/5